MEDDIFSSDVVVMGCGNALYHDDGVGCSVAKMLIDLEALPSDVYVVDAGLAAPRLINLLKTRSHRPRLIIIDAGDFGGGPGDVRIYDVSASDKAIYPKTSHGVSLIDELLTYGSNVHMVVCQTRKDTMDLNPFCLSKEVESSLGRVCDEVRALVNGVNV